MVTSQVKKQLNMQIGQRIHERRRFMGLSAEQLAERSDISIKQLRAIESGKRGMSFISLINICGVLCISTDYIILGKQQTPCLKDFHDMISIVDEDFQPYLYEIIKTFLSALATILIKASKKTEDLCS